MVLTLSHPIAAAPGLQRVNVFAVDGKDPRQPQTRLGDGIAFGAIGVIETHKPVFSSTSDPTKRGISSATVFMISPCYALSTFHAVFGEYQRQPDDEKDHSVTLRIGEGVGGAFAHQTAARPVKYGKYWMNKVVDYAILKLDDCLGLERDVGWVDLEPLPPTALRHATVRIAGFYGDREFGHQLLLSKPCRIVDQIPGDSRSSLTDCPATPGTSGAPILVVETGRVKVVAIMLGPYDANIPGLQKGYTPEMANQTLDVGALMQELPGLAQAIEVDVRAHGVANPSHTAPVEP